MTQRSEARLATRRATGGSESREEVVVAGTYRIISRLGGGGMGEVYEAEHIRLNTRVAVKLLRANALDDARAVERFHSEARRVAELRSENVVNVFDCGQLPDGTPYLAMERLVGDDLRALLARETSLPPRRAVKLVLEACRGLCDVHAAGIVHRDLKPANLFVVRRSSGSELCKILDFGVAKARASDATEPGALLGTVRYMAPEQLANSAAATPSCDVYALGAILYECLTGVPAHPGETNEEIMFHTVHGDPRPPCELVPLPEGLERVVLSALSRDPGRRFQTAEAFARALAPFGPVSATAAAFGNPDDSTVAQGSTGRAPLGLAHAGFTRRHVWLMLGLLTLGSALGWFIRGAVSSRAEAQRHDGVSPATLAAAARVPKPAESGFARGTSATRVVEATKPDLPAVPSPEPASSRRPRVRSESAAPGEAFSRRFDSHNPYVE